MQLHFASLHADINFLPASGKETDVCTQATFSFILLVSSLKTSRNCLVAILKISASCSIMITSRRVITCIERYDVILNQSERTHLYNHLKIIGPSGVQFGL